MPGEHKTMTKSIIEKLLIFSLATKGRTLQDLEVMLQSLGELEAANLILSGVNITPLTPRHLSQSGAGYWRPILHLSGGWQHYSTASVCVRMHARRYWLIILCMDSYLNSYYKVSVSYHSITNKVTWVKFPILPSKQNKKPKPYFSRARALALRLRLDNTSVMTVQYQCGWNSTRWASFDFFLPTQCTQAASLSSQLESKSHELLSPTAKQAIPEAPAT